MATRRSTRVTQVDPWIIGGEGQLRDLFPLPPHVFLLLRFLGSLLRHWQLTLLTLTAFLLWAVADWGAILAFIVYPITMTILRASITLFYLWYKNPSIPLIARKNN